LVIAAMADLHMRIGDLGRWSPLFMSLEGQARVLVIAGDLTDTGDEEEAELLAAELRACPVPVVAVLGNHDHEKGRQKLVRQALQSERVHILDGEAVEVAGIGFAGIKGFCGGFDGHMLSLFGEAAMKAFVQECVDETLRLDRALDRLERSHLGMKKVAVMHYAPIVATVQGEPPQIHPFLGSSRLAEPLTRRHVDMVFHGHAHHGSPEGRLPNGTPVYNVAYPSLRHAGIDTGLRLVRL
jgi:Icc-related predicted phosphoesterase